jgi:hypothetical protein
MPFRAYGALKEVPRVATLSDEDFYWRYMWTNLPVLIGPAMLGRWGVGAWARTRRHAHGFADAPPTDWPALQTWVDGGRPDLAYLRTHYGHCEVPVVECVYVREREGECDGQAD